MLSFIFNRTPKDKDLLYNLRKSHLGTVFAAKALTMIGKGANANAANAESGWTALHYAAAKGKKDLVESLIEHGAEVNAISTDGENATPLSRLVGCAQFGNDPVELVKYLLDKGADPNKGEPALVNAALHGHFDSFRLLLASGADPKATDEEGYTALHYVAREDDLNLARLLIEKGADFGAKNNKGKTPADYLEWLDNDARAEFLRKWELELDAPKRLKLLEELVASATTLEKPMAVSRPLRLRSATP